jgi:hypothetical protein
MSERYPDDLGICRDAAGLSDRCRELADRLVRHRATTLTDAEREALNNASRWLVAIQSADDPRAGECAATLRGLLQRLGGAT